jgi:small subunit ribosomal protein S20
LPSAKTHRAQTRRADRQAPLRTRTKSTITAAREAIAGDDMELAEQEVRSAVVALDKAAKKGVIHKANASRRKSRIMKQLAAAKASA